MAIKDKEGRWLNRNGKAISPTTIDTVTKRRDATVEKIVARARKLRAHMQKQKYLMQKDIDKYYEYLQKSAKAKDFTDSKGNASLIDYAGLKKVKIGISDVFEYDERLQIAKSLMDEVALEKANDDEELVSMINVAFGVDSKGRPNRTMLTRLTKVKSKDPRWKRACELIRESEDIIGSRQYLNIQERTERGGEFKTINFNFSSL